MLKQLFVASCLVGAVAAGVHAQYAPTDAPREMDPNSLLRPQQPPAAPTCNQVKARLKAIAERAAKIREDAKFITGKPWRDLRDEYNRLEAEERPLKNQMCPSTGVEDLPQGRRSIDFFDDNWPALPGSDNPVNVGRTTPDAGKSEGSTTPTTPSTTPPSVTPPEGGGTPAQATNSSDALCQEKVQGWRRIMTPPLNAGPDDSLPGLRQRIEQLKRDIESRRTSASVANLEIQRLSAQASYLERQRWLLKEMIDTMGCDMSTGNMKGSTAPALPLTTTVPASIGGSAPPH